MRPNRTRRSLRCLYFVGLVVLLAPPPATAQETPDTLPAARPAAVPADSVRPLSAQGALIRSFVLPGWGQTYVGAHGRGAFYFALESGTHSMVYKTSRARSAARDHESNMRENGALGSTERLPLAESRAQQVEDWITLSIFWALFAGADAYVSAQLADFAGHVGAAPGPSGELRFQVRMDVGGPR